MQSSRLFSVTDVARAVRKGEFGLAARIGRRVCSNVITGVAPGHLSVHDAARAVRKGEIGLALRIGHDLCTDAVNTACAHVRQQSRSVLRRFGRTS
jgi:hypothetical protein